MLVLAAGSMLDVGAAEHLDAAAEAGFDGVGLRVTGPHRPPDAAAWRAAAAAAGIAAHDAEVVRIGTDAPDIVDDTIAAAAALGVGRLLVVSDVADLDVTARELDRVVAQAAARGLAVGLEYMAWTTPSGPFDAVELARRTGCEIVVDLLHHVRVGAGVSELAAVVESGHLGWLQLCDAPAAAPSGRGDLDALVHEARHERAAPGAGALPLRALLAAVPDTVTLSVEVQSDTLSAVPPGERARRLYRAAVAVIGDRGPGAHQPSSTG